MEEEEEAGKEVRNGRDWRSREGKRREREKKIVISF